MNSSNFLVCSVACFLNLALMGQEPLTADSEFRSELNAYSDFFSQSTNFSLAMFRFSPRALRANELRLNGVSLTDPQSGQVPWGALGSLLAVAQGGSETFGIPFSRANVGIGTLVGGEWLTIEPLAKHAGAQAELGLSNRVYTYRLGASYNLHTKNNWGLTIDLQRRWGRSLTTSGVWADAWTGLIAAQKKFDRGHSLCVTLMVAPTARATAAPATDEAFELSRSNLYNPSWGVWNGSQRSSRVRQNFEPMVMVNHEWQIDESYTLKNAIFVRTGRAAQSSLTWQNAPNPLPDYWAAMPSAQPSKELEQSVADAWRNDVSVGQINYEFIEQINSENSPRAKYVLQDRVREMSQITLQSSIFGQQFAAGVSTTFATSLNYKQMGDLMGAQYWLDIDSFVEMDDDVRELTQNNLAQPNRHIGRGDRFGYNYTINTFATTLWGAYDYRRERWRLSFGASVASRVDQRVGHYEKENFPDGRSLGASAPIATLDLTAKAVATYALGSKFVLDMAIGYQRANKATDKIFISPTTRNAPDPVLRPASIAASEISAKYHTPSIKATASLFCTLTLDDSHTENLYSDPLRAYVHYSMEGINTLGYGLHGAVEVALPANLSIAAALALQSHTYTSNPTATAYRETTGEMIEANQRVLYKGLPTALAPTAGGVLSLSYRPLGWIVSLSAVGRAGASALPSPIRRTYQALSKAASSSVMERMQNAEQLPSSVTLDLMAGHRWFFDRTNQSLGLYCGVNNLLNNTSIKSVGYESSRLRNIGSTYAPALVPHDTKYYYALGANFFVNVSYRF